jgi:hypothetical protein
LPDNIYKDVINPSVFIFRNYYFSYKFYDIIPDSRAAGISSAGESQIQILQKKNLSIKLDIITTRINHIKFSKKKTIIKGIIRVLIFIGTITFYIIPFISIRHKYHKSTI